MDGPGKSLTASLREHLVTKGFTPHRVAPPTALRLVKEPRKVTKEKRKRRPAGEKIKVLDFGAKHSPKEACEKFGVSGSLFYRWRDDEAKIRKQARLDAGQNGEAVEPVQRKKPGPKPKAESQPIAPPSTPRATLTGLGPLIADVRAVVISEISAQIGEMLGPMIDGRMPEIVSRELRKLLDENAPKSAKAS